MQSANYSKISSFINKKIIEIIGLLTVLLSFFLLLSLSTYTPEDPNFIFSENTKIHNLFGFLYFQKIQKYTIYLDFMEALSQMIVKLDLI